jgi:hypothetical protein
MNIAGSAMVLLSPIEPPKTSSDEMTEVENLKVQVGTIKIDSASSVEN